MRLDGLSIPFFSFGRNVRARTVSLTQTWTLRTGSIGPAAPDWTLWARRAPEGHLGTRPGTPLDVGGTGDVECGLDRKVVPAGVAEPQDAQAPAEEDLDVANMHARDVDEDVPELGPAAMIGGRDATAGPAPVLAREAAPALAPQETAVHARDTVRWRLPCPKHARRCANLPFARAAGTGGR